MLEEGLKFVHLDCILFVGFVTIWINEISGKFGLHFNFNNALAPLSHNAVGSRSFVEPGGASIQDVVNVHCNATSIRTG